MQRKEGGGKDEEGKDEEGMDERMPWDEGSSTGSPVAMIETRWTVEVRTNHKVKNSEIRSCHKTERQTECYKDKDRKRNTQRYRKAEKTSNKLLQRI